MLEQHLNTQERLDSASKRIDNWLKERQELIVRYYHLATHQEHTLDAHKLNLFCQLLVDYICAGHFEVYEHLFAEGDAFQDDRIQQVQSIPTLLADSTQQLMALQDQLLQPGAPSSSLSQLLSHMGETLEKHFTLEDQMIAILHTEHQSMTC